jgi:hypothetical protein
MWLHSKGSLWSTFKREIKAKWLPHVDVIYTIEKDVLTHIWRMLYYFQVSMWESYTEKCLSIKYVQHSCFEICALYINTNEVYELRSLVRLSVWKVKGQAPPRGLCMILARAGARGRWYHAKPVGRCLTWRQARTYNARSHLRKDL